MIGKISFFLVFLSVQPVFAGERIDETLPADTDGIVEVSNIAGEVKVYGWDRKEVEVVGELGKDVERLVFERNGSHTLIKVIYPKKHFRSRNSSFLRIKIPKKSQLNINVVSADVEVLEVRGDQRIIGVSADIYSEVFTSELNLHVVSGDVQIKGANTATRIQVTTVSGDVVAENILGEFEFSSVSGDLVVSAKELVRVRAKTTNGNIDVHADLEKDGRIDAHTVNGDVEIALANGKHLSVNVETLNGDIESCFGESAEQKHKYSPGQSMRFSHGDTRRQVSISTLNGDVDICI